MPTGNWGYAMQIQSLYQIEDKCTKFYVKILKTFQNFCSYLHLQFLFLARLLNCMWLSTTKMSFSWRPHLSWSRRGKFRNEVVYFASNGLYKMFFYVKMPSHLLWNSYVPSLLLTIYFLKIFSHFRFDF